jgi:(1->4)-alpha-D-glucan 1-alpha-D-glucosylmutase
MLDTVDNILRLPPEQRRGAIGRLLATPASGAIKLMITAAALRVRSARADLFLDGEYVPLDVEAAADGRALAFARLGADGSAAIALAPHLAAPLISAERPLPTGDVWRTSRVLLPAAFATLTFTDAFTGATIRPVTSGSGSWLFVGQALDLLPVALLVGSQ